jgi:hypothetical protein
MDVRQELDLVDKYQPVLLFSMDERGRSDEFYPLAAEDYVQECGLYRRRSGWVQEPDSARLEHLGGLPRSEDCFLAYVAGDPHDVHMLMDLFERGCDPQHDACWSPELVYDKGQSVLRFTAAHKDALCLERELSQFDPRRRSVDVRRVARWLAAANDPRLLEHLQRTWGLSSELQEAYSDLGSLTDLVGHEVQARGLEHIYLEGSRGIGHALRNQAVAEYEPYKHQAPVYYYHLTRSPSTGWGIIQYWFLYAYNDWGWHGGCNDHEGDWEMIAVLLQDWDDPGWVVYSQHMWFDKRRWSELADVRHPATLQDPAVLGPLRWEGTHPLVFVGCGSHASYACRGRFCGWDVARGNDAVIGLPLGKAWAPPRWIEAELWNSRFEGLWGAPFRQHLTAPPVPGHHGPKGPAYAGLKWSDTAAWAHI